MKKLIVLIITLVMVAVSTADAKKRNKFRELQNQINDISLKMESMKAKEHIEVYAADDQFIGYLYGGVIYHILIPELDAFVEFDLAGQISYHGQMYYTEQGCAGQSYWGRGGEYRKTKIIKRIGPKLFVIDPEYVNVPINSVFMDWSPPTCIDTTEPVTVPGSPSLEIQEVELPFNLPVALPLRYK